MPQHTRNFWIESDIDGRATPASGGPRASEGGFTTKVSIRQAGVATHALTIEGWATEDGRLILAVHPSSGLAWQLVGGSMPSIPLDPPTLTTEVVR